MYFVEYDLVRSFHLTNIYLYLFSNLYLGTCLHNKVCICMDICECTWNSICVCIIFERLINDMAVLVIFNMLRVVVLLTSTSIKHTNV